MGGGEEVSFFNLYSVSTSCYEKDAATSWLKEVDAKALIFSLRCMDTAYQNFFKHQSGFPRFKAKYDRNQSYQTYQDVSFSYDKSKLYLPKMQEGIKCIFSLISATL